MSRLRPVRHRHDDAVSRLGAADIEQRLAAHFAAQGFAVRHTTGDAHDGDFAIHLDMLRGQDRVLVHYRHWPAFQVPQADVEAWHARGQQEGATCAMLVTSGEICEGALRSAAGRRTLRLIDGKGLRSLLGPVDDTPLVTRFDWAPIATPAARAPARVFGVAVVAMALAMGLAIVSLYSLYIPRTHQRSTAVAPAPAVYGSPSPPPYAGWMKLPRTTRPMKDELATARVPGP
jgi:restriction system protein